MPHFEYRLDLSFSEAARDHHLSLRGAPALTRLWTPASFSVVTDPVTPLRVRRDPWDNLIYEGEVPLRHDRWSAVFSGEGEWTGEGDPRTPGDGALSAPGALTAWGPALEQLWNRWRGASLPLERRSRSLSDLLADHLTYQAGATGAQTTADQAADLGLGVCQDWAQVFLCLWRRSGAEGRYAAGLAEGEGQTHAWVELGLGTIWSPWDPLRRTPALAGWLPLARGRDAADCRLNRGVFRGGGLQTLRVTTRLFSPTEAAC